MLKKSRNKEWPSRAVFREVQMIPKHQPTKKSKNKD